MRRVRYLVVSAVALFGCGEDSGPDVEKVEKDLAGVVEEQTGTRDVEVACPADVEEGDLCEVTATGGVRAQVRVERLDGDDADGQVVQP